MIQYHGHLSDLPEKYAHLPVIGFVRNPWDWYVSMFFDYKRKRQYIFQTICEEGALDFKTTIARFLNLGDRSDFSQRILAQLAVNAPQMITDQTPQRKRNPGLRSEHFANYPENAGYYSWLVQLMYKSDRNPTFYIGRFEDLRNEVLRLFEETDTPITRGISTYLNEDEILNMSQRPSIYSERYSSELRHLVADKERTLIDEFSYEFSATNVQSKYPKTEYFNQLGTVDVSALVERVKNIPESLWEHRSSGKPNNFGKLNDTAHILFRYIQSPENVFDYDTSPLWRDWEAILLPLMEQAAERLGYKNYRFPRAMFARVPAGSKISPHADLSASHYIHKIHIPIITNSDTAFHVGDQVKNLQVGEMVEVNNKRMHAVFNSGQEDRVHFIFECYNLADYGKAS